MMEGTITEMIRLTSRLTMSMSIGKPAGKAATGGKLNLRMGL
jgi:hypothetical protein